MLVLKGLDRPPGFRAGHAIDGPGVKPQQVEQALGLGGRIPSRLEPSHRVLAYGLGRDVSRLNPAFLADPPQPLGLAASRPLVRWVGRAVDPGSLESTTHPAAIRFDERRGNDDAVMSGFRVFPGRLGAAASRFQRNVESFLDVLKIGEGRILRARRLREQNRAHGHNDETWPCPHEYAPPLSVVRILPLHNATTRRPVHLNRSRTSTFGKNYRAARAVLSAPNDTAGETAGGACSLPQRANISLTEEAEPPGRVPPEITYTRPSTTVAPRP